MSLTWKLGTFEIATGRRLGESAKSAAERWEAGDRETDTVSGLVSGLFGVHMAPGAWTLTARSCGFRIADSDDLVKVLELAERVADLDWSGSPIELGDRNSSAVNKAREEINP